MWFRKVVVILGFAKRMAAFDALVIAKYIVVDGLTCGGTSN